MDYYRHTSGGFMLDCKACWRAKVKAHREANADYFKEYDRQRANLPHRMEARMSYARTPEGKEALRRGTKAWIERNPLKRAAQISVGNALRDGKLARKPCEVCSAERAHAHHDDYTKPLDVRWLCTTHHAEWHKHNTPICPDQSQAA